MNLSPLIMRKSNPMCWMLMPAFAKAIRDFSREHVMEGFDICADRFEAAFGLGANEMLGIAIVSDELPPAQLAGHVICGVERYLGQDTGMVYQFHKGTGTSGDWSELNKGIQALIDNWCHMLNLPEVMAMAETESRARLFGMFGYSPGPVLMRRRL